MQRTFLIALIAALLGVGLLAGCGGDDDNGGGGSDTTTESEKQDTTQTDSTETETEPEQGEDSPSGSEDQFDEEFSQVNDDLRALGEKVGQAVNSARGKSDAALATQFTDLGEETQEIKTRLDELEPPEDLVALRDRLSKAVDTVASDLSDIGQAAEDSDAGEARKQATELVRHSVEVRNARRALARETGAKV